MQIILGVNFDKLSKIQKSQPSISILKKSKSLLKKLFSRTLSKEFSPEKFINLFIFIIFLSGKLILSSSNFLLFASINIAS